MNRIDNISMDETLNDIMDDLDQEFNYEPSKEPELIDDLDFEEEIQEQEEANVLTLPSTSTLESKSKEYKKIGWVAIPLGDHDKKKEGKAPIAKGWQNAELNTKFSWAGSKNIGVVAGKISGIVCLDIDTEDNGVNVFEKLKAKNPKIPDCPIQKTPKGGYHYIFKYSDRLGKLKSSSKLVKQNNSPVGIDLKTNDGQFVVEPSVNRVNFKPYKWVRSPFQVKKIPEMPEWIIKLLEVGNIDDNYNLVLAKEKIIESTSEEDYEAFASLNLPEFSKNIPLKRRTVLNSCEKYFWNILCLLQPQEFQKYDNWFRNGAAIFNFYNGDKKKTEDIWGALSKQHDNGDYDDDELKEKINEFSLDKEKKLGLKYLEDKAKEQNPVEFKKLQALRNKKSNNSSVANLYRGDEGFSDIFVEKVINDIKVIDSKGNCYMFSEKSKLWEEHHDGFIMNKISVLLEPILEEEIENIKIQILDVPKNIDDEEEAKAKVKRLQLTLQDLIKSLKYVLSTRGASQIAKKACPKLEEPDFIKKLNINPDLLPIKNGKVVNLQTGLVSERTKEHYFSFECSVAIEQDLSQIEKVDKFMLDICNGNNELKEYFRKSLGYCLTGHITERCFFIWWGAGKNGKSTVAESIMKKIMSKFWVSITKDVFIKSDDSRKSSGAATPHIMPLIGARMAIFSESEKQEKINSGLIKKITGADTIRCRPLYGNTIEFDPICKMVMMTNFKPDLDTDDQAILDRLKYVPFLARFSDTPAEGEYKRDIKIVRQIENELLNAAFTWIIEGAKEWYQTGLINMPEIIVNETSKYISELDDVSQFINEECSITKIDSDRIGVSDIHKTYVSWCRENEKTPKTSKEFSDMIIKNFKLVKVKSSGIMNWKGIKYIENNNDLGDD